MGINDMAKSSGRVLKEDGSYINQADMIEALIAELKGVLSRTSDIKTAVEGTINTQLTAILAKIISAPASEAKQDTQITRLNLLSTEATLAAILAKIIAAPSTEAKQDTQITRLNLLSTEATLEAVRAALVAGGLPATTLETTHQNAASTNIPGVAATVSGYGPIGFQATGVFDGATVTYEGSVDGTNYVALSGSSAVTAVGIFKTDVSGLKNVRAVISNAGASTSLTVKSLAVAVAKPTSANVTAVGAAAHDAAATGNPVQIGGVYRVADPVLADGDAGSLRLNAKGEARVELTGSNVEQTLGAVIPAKANLIGISDGVNIRAMTGNLEVAVLASAARTTSVSSADFQNHNARGIIIYFNISAVPGVDTVTLSLQAKAPDGIYHNHLNTTARATTGGTSYVMYPGATDSGSRTSGKNELPLARTWRITVAHSGVGSFTYSVGAHLII